MTSLRVHPGIYGNANLILEKLHHEAIEIHSVRANYIPRILVGEDSVLGEDRLSKFENSYPVDVYIQNVEGMEGQGSFASKFGLMIESSATVLISKRGWDQMVGQYGKTILPNRPSEGDLIYIPMTKGLFEIMFVDHQTPFYQLGQFYSYKMTIELFRYSSEKIDTGVNDIDAFEQTHSTDIDIRSSLDELLRGADNTKVNERKDNFVLDVNNIFGDI
jgi:hypothetical protein